MSERLLGVLALTHSSRRTNPARCSVQFLTRRFSDPRRGHDLPPFDHLPPTRALYSGAASFYRLARTAGGLTCRPLGRLAHRDKIQHAVWLDDRQLVIGYEHRLERWRLGASVHDARRFGWSDLEAVAVLEHPHLAGLHTVEPFTAAGGGRRLAVSCSASDSVLLYDLDHGRWLDGLRLPAELYGRFYDLTPDMDLRRHYIDDEGQRTHVNAAYPTADGRRILVSTLIQGAIGAFDLAGGDFREITRGFVGCHGVRQDGAGRTYFTDSTAGHLVFLDEGGTVRRRFAVRSRWLHDTVQVDGGLFAFALADRNELRILDVDADRLLFRRSFFTWPLDGLFTVARRFPGWLGNSVQALSFFPAPRN